MDTLKLTYIGHATCDIDIADSHVLTDPVFSSRIFFIKRASKLKVDPTKLVRPEAILISHCHYDHFDIGSFKYIESCVPVIIPEGASKYFERTIKNPVIELSTWSTHKFPSGMEITATPNRHNGGRNFVFLNKNSNGYIIKKKNSCVYFCGDSALGEHFHDIGASNDIDIALLPIGAYAPAWFMKSRHMNPEEALQAFGMLKAKRMIPTHWGTFKLSLENLDEPIKWMKKIVDDRKLNDRVSILEDGQSFSF